MSKLHVSQTFYSFQGEGSRTGNLAVWLRLFGCNLRCPGFSQPDPADPKTYIKPISFDPKSIKVLDDFPVLEYGCDTLYAIDPRFKHLKRSMEILNVWDEIKGLLPNGKWEHPVTKNKIDLCITGGEPLLQQKALNELLKNIAIFHLDSSLNAIKPYVQFETNGTQVLSDEFSETIYFYYTKVQFNVSLKLKNVSGEDYDWDHNVIRSLMAACGKVDLKIVLNSSDKAWDELMYKTESLFSKLGSLPQIYIMPVGSTREQQTNEKELEIITKRALDAGFHISGRLHAVLLGNDVNV